MTRGLELYDSPARQAAARLVAQAPGGTSARLGRAVPLRYVDRGDPRPPDGRWVRVRPSLAGIGGADLALVTGRASAYLTAVVGLPFVPGREVVGRVEQQVTLTGGQVLAAGARVVVDPVAQVDPGAQAGPGLRAGEVGVGGGGWSRVMLAHHAQLQAVPDGLPDERAVLVDALARAVHTVDRARVSCGARVLVVGAGALGLFTVLALRAFTDAGPVAVVARHPRQAQLAARFGADAVFDPAGAVAGVRRGTQAMRVTPDSGGSFLLGGVDVALEAAGSGAALATALRTTRAGGRVVVAGTPSGRVDLTPLWARGLELVGAARTTADPGGADVLARAWALAGAAPLDGLVTGGYPLTRWRDALAHALGAGRLGAVRVAFDPAAPS
ncbi:medium chain dehydrogenase/reductase family protein [Frankia sp. QA3]|uniref:MDR/zinc-dependent alcohol dehydrogenase-like family protein n=1 Tax=Frankia sp. QA3 TaxID=710111 RepID=UPI000269BC4E|nr:medium chain dehydrogenase/reductase family protein [Frankia sp. QA3]EIV92200.1 theronine dehydrogenase-like Zn-dependent dehydrogenase [Frankia sp. QA3]